MIDKIDSLLHLPTPLERIQPSWAKTKGVSVFIKRDDLIHPHICGNKWRKIKYNLIEAQNLNCTSLVSMGGAFSNHLVAVAAVGFYAGLPTYGYIRSYQPALENQTIQILNDYGMNYSFVHPKLYDSQDWKNDIKNQSGKSYLIPEGGTNEVALKGIGEMMSEIDCNRFSHILTSIGTGGTLAGMVKHNCKAEIIAVSPFRNHTSVFAGLQYVESNESNFRIINSKLNSNFASFHPNIVDYCNSFYNEFGIILDPVYTVKTMMTLEFLVESSVIPSGANVLFLHTGGLQGIEGFNSRYNCTIHPSRY